jgi:hypothetical protein
MTGAEAQSSAVFNGVATCLISTITKRTGGASFDFDTATAPANHTLPANVAQLYFRIGAYFTFHNTTGSGVLMVLYDSNGDPQLSFCLDNVTNLMTVKRGAPNVGTALETGTQVISQDVWHCLEIWIYVDNDAGTGRVVTKVDGTQDIDYTGDTQATANANVRAFRLMYYSATRFSMGFLDDIAINDTAGAVNNSWIGRGGIHGIVPDGVGNYTDLHAQGHANAWDCISEVPPDDADYVYDDVVDQKSTYALTALVPATGTIDCINVIMRAKLDAAGAGNIARLIRSNGTDSQGADVGLDATAKTITEIIETDPSGGGAWTIARVNALEAGAVVR